LGKFKDILTDSGDDCNYALFIPIKEAVIGYFSTKNLNFSVSQKYTYKKLDEFQNWVLNDKITRAKFVSRFEIEGNTLDKFVLFIEKNIKNLDSAKNNIDNGIIGIRNSLEKLSSY